MRKKEKLELPIYPTLPDIGVPEIIEVTSLTDTCRQFVASTSPGVSCFFVLYWSFWRIENNTLSVNTFGRSLFVYNRI